MQISGRGTQRIRFAASAAIERERGAYLRQSPFQPIRYEIAQACHCVITWRMSGYFAFSGIRSVLLPEGSGIRSVLLPEGLRRRKDHAPGRSDPFVIGAGAQWDAIKSETFSRSA